MKTIPIPKQLVWDYKEPPDDLLWRLQRVADFFPAYGTDRKTVKLLLKYRHKLKLEEGTDKLIVLYKMRSGMKKPVRGVKDNRVLTASQIAFLREFIPSDLKDVFRLTGGTALSAFYLEHRISEDLDFFLPKRLLCPAWRGC